MLKSIQGGKHEGKFLMRLEMAYKAGTAAGTLASFCGQRACRDNFAKMKECIGVLGQQQMYPTENICRQWTAEYAQDCLSGGNILAFVEALQVHRPEGESERSEDWLPSPDTFDLDAPVMWKVCPTIADCEAAEEEPEPRPELPAQIPDWEMNRAYDKSVRSFPSFFCNAWACDALYDMLQNNITKATELMGGWQAACQGIEQDSLPPKVWSALQRTTTFARAYLAIASSDVLDVALHQAYTTVFMPQMGKPQGELYSLLSSAARKNKDFKDLESKIIKLSPTELEHGVKLAEAIEKANSDAMDFDAACEYIAELPQWQKGCRAVAVARIEPALKTFFTEHTKQLTSEAQGELDWERSNQVHTELATCEKHLVWWGKGLDPEAKKTLETASSTIKELSRSLTAGKLAEWAEAEEDTIEDIEGASFVAHLDKVRDNTTPGVLSSLRTIEAKLMRSAKDIAVNTADESLHERWKQLAANLVGLQAHLGSSQVDAAGVVQPIVNNALAVHVAYEAYNGNKSKANRNALNKAAVAWWHFKLSTTHQQVGYNVAFLKQALAGVQTALAEHRVLQRSAVGAAEQELQMQIDDLRKIAYGTRNGESWKAEIDETWSLDSVLDLAHTSRTGLVHGPGIKVMGAKAELEKAHSHGRARSLSMLFRIRLLQAG